MINFQRTFLTVHRREALLKRNAFLLRALMNGLLALRMRTRTLLTIELTFVAVGRMRSSPRRRTLEPPAAVQRVGVAFFVGLFKTLNSEQCSSTSPGQLPPERSGERGLMGVAAEPHPP